MLTRLVPDGNMCVCQLSMSVASINARALSGWLGAPQASDLVLPSLDVSITAFEHGSMNRQVRETRRVAWPPSGFGNAHCSLSFYLPQASGSAAGFVALVIAMGGRLKDGKVIMTGEVDLRGKVVTVRGRKGASATLRDKGMAQALSVAWLVLECKLGRKLAL